MNSRRKVQSQNESDIALVMRIEELLWFHHKLIKKELPPSILVSDFLYLINTS